MKPFLQAGARDIGLNCAFDDADFDQMYLDQLLHWVSQSSLGAVVLLAYEWVHDDRGTVRKDLSDLFVSNDAVFAATKRFSKLLPGVAIHPARPDALEELERCAAAGAVLLKLLPCVRHGGCDRPKFKRFWTRLAELGLPFLAPTGGELFGSNCSQHFKFLQCLLLPLECGVTVIAA